MPHFMGEIPDLDKLVPGEVLLGVPVEDGAILMHSSSDEKAQLAIGINPGIISVARKDEEDLQIHSFFEEWNPDANCYFPTSALLLEEPAKRLTFMRLDAGWNIEEATPAEGNAKRLTSFARLVGEHALIKQREQRRKGKR